MKYCNSINDCVLNSLIPLPSIIYVILNIILTIKLKHNLYDHLSDDNKWDHAIINFDKPSQYNILLIVIFILFLLIILILAFACDDKKSGSLIFSTFFQVLAWLMISYNIVQESWYIFLWPR